METAIWELKEGSSDMRIVAEYKQPPKKALICFIMQHIRGNYNTWEYPENIQGMRESDTVADHWYFDVFQGRDGGKYNAVYAAYPCR